MTRRPARGRPRVGGGTVSSALLALGAGAFSRASRATVVNASTVSIVAAGAMRNRGGGIVLEGARTNLAGSAGARGFSAGDGWSGGTSGLTYTAGAVNGPDGSSLTADRCVVTGGGYGPNLSAAGAGWSYLSIWMRAFSGTGSGQTLVGYTGPTWTGTRVALTETWQRVTSTSTASDTAALFSVADARAIGGGTAAAIDACVDLCTIGRELYCTSDIVDGSRDADVLTWDASEVPLQLREGVSRWRLHPCHASSQLAASDSRVIASFGGANDRLELYNDAGTRKVRVIDNGSMVAERTVTWSADQAATSAPLTIVLDAAAGTIQCSGFATGDGTTTGTPWAWPGGVSFRLGGVFGAASEIDGTVYLPERA